MRLKPLRVALALALCAAAQSARATNIGVPVPLATTGAAGSALTNRSGSIISGGTAQSPFGANAGRHGCLLQNQSADDMWIDPFGTASAGQPSLRVPAGSFWTCESSGVPTSAISLYDTVTGDTFAAWEW